MEALHIHTLINSQYQVFDASGQLPFNIVFGLCRRSSNDTDPRPLTLQRTESILDVSYALAKGLLKLYEHNSCNEQEVEVKLNDLSVESRPRSYLTLTSPASRTGNWRNGLKIIHCEIDVTSDIASRLQNGKKYSMRMASQDLDVKWWAWGEQAELLDMVGQPSQVSESARLVKHKLTEGKASFEVVPSLPWPPQVNTHLCLQKQDARNTDQNILLTVSVVNTADKAVTVQTRGHQHTLLAWGPLQPEGQALDFRPRIIDTSGERPPRSSLEIIHLASGEVVRKISQSHSAPLTASHDIRPKGDVLMTLYAGVPFARSLDIGTMLHNLPDGRYGVRLAPRGIWWCWGSQEEVVDSESGRVSEHLFQRMIPPLMLQSHDIVELQVHEGKVVF